MTDPATDYQRCCEHCDQNSDWHRAGPNDHAVPCPECDTP